MRNDLTMVRMAIVSAPRPMMSVTHRPRAAFSPTVLMVLTSVSEKSRFWAVPLSACATWRNPSPATRTNSNGTMTRNRRKAMAPASMPPAIDESRS